MKTAQVKVNGMVIDMKIVKIHRSIATLKLHAISYKLRNTCIIMNPNGNGFALVRR